jgi:hypothetical protein
MIDNLAGPTCDNVRLFTCQIEAMLIDKALVATSEVMELDSVVTMLELGMHVLAVMPDPHENVAVG